MKKLFVFLLVAAMAVGLFVGCANNNGNTPAQTEATQSSGGVLDLSGITIPSGTVPTTEPVTEPVTEATDSLVGTYEAYQMEISGQFYTMQEIGETLGTGYAMTLVFCADGTGYDIETYGETNTIPYTWTRSGNTVTINDETGARDMQLNGTELIFDIGDAVCHLHKTSDTAEPLTGGQAAAPSASTPVEAPSTLGDGSTYTLSSMVVNGTTVSADLIGVEMSITLYQDGTGVVESAGNEGEVEWTLNGTSLVLHDESGETLTGSFDGYAISLELDSGTLVFTK